MVATPYIYSDCEATAEEEIYNTNMNKHTHTYMPTYVHTYLHTYKYTYIQTYKILQTLQILKPNPTNPSLT